jgi:general stress protein 26
MNRTDLVTFLRAQKWAVQASTARDGAPQAAVIGLAVTDRLELVFDTVGDTRKAANLRANPAIALVVGWDEGQTVQLEGMADEPAGDELARLKRTYFDKFPDGTEREAWPGITYFRVFPHWVRYSDFRGATPIILTWTGDTLRELMTAPR